MRSEEVVLRKNAQGHGYGNAEIHMRTKFHFHALCLRSEEAVIGKSARGHFLFMVVMETLEYTCVPSFTSMYCMVGKFEK